MNTNRCFDKPPLAAPFAQACLGLFVVLSFLLSMSLPLFAQVEQSLPETLPSTELKIPLSPEPEYITGKVTEIESKVEITDQVFGRQEHKIRFRVQFSAQGNDPAESVSLEQTYDQNTPDELWPRKGKAFVFYKETLADQSHVYTLIDVQRLNHIPWVAFLVCLLLILLGRWFGLKALLISGGMISVFYLLHLLSLPWLVSSTLTFVAIVSLSALLTYGLGPRFVACLLAGLGGGVLSLVMVWLSSWFSVSQPSVILHSGMILQMGAGLSYIAISTINAAHLSLRQEPGLKSGALFRKSFVGGQGAIEVVSTLYLIFALGQILATAYAQGNDPGRLEMEVLLTEMASLLFMLLGFVVSLPLSAWVASHWLIRKRR